MKRAFPLLLLLTACETPTAQVDHSRIAKPDASFTVRADPLPEIPECDRFVKPKDRTACRVAYDEAVRSMYVRLGARHDALVDWAEAVAR